MSTFLEEAIDDYNSTRETATSAPQTSETVGVFTDVQTEKLNGQPVGLMAYRDPIAADPDDPIAPPPAVDPAPLAYSQAYADEQTDAINVLRANVAALAAELHDLKAKARTAGHLAT